MFYNQARQELESRVSASENTGPESLQPQQQYVWSQRYIDAPVLRDKNTDADGLCDDQRLYYLGDANFNVTTLVNTGGDGLKRYVYSPYGVLTIYGATWTNTRSTPSYANAYTYTGRHLDAETGLYYYRHRIYHAGLGRFGSRDPVRSGLNLYGYCDSNALTRTDPNGLESSFTVYDNGNGQLCGYSVWLLTGSWCSDPDVVIAATDRYDEYMTCWWRCEVAIHKCAGGKLLVATEVVTGATSLAGARVPKDLRQFLCRIGCGDGWLGSQGCTSLSRVIGRLLNLGEPTQPLVRSYSEQLGRAFGRSRVVAVAKGVFVATAVIEAGISITCGLSCR